MSFRIGDWVAPSDGVKRNLGLPKMTYRVDDVGVDHSYIPGLDCVKIAGVWIYATDCVKAPTPPPTLAEKEAAANAKDGWRRRQDAVLRDIFKPVRR